jgi:hypothetical protein
VVAGASGVDEGVWEGPIARRSDGQLVSADWVHVGADNFGRAYGPHCEGWTSSDPGVQGGSSGFASEAGPDARGFVDCDVAMPLFCVQVGGPFFEEPIESEGLPVFITSTTSEPRFGASFGGDVPEAADDFCEAAAADGGLVGYRWTAWMSDPEDDALCRLVGGSGTIADGCGGAEMVGGPWVRTDGIAVAASLEDLVDMRIEAFINRDELGNGVPGGVYAYTGTRATGVARDAYLCSDDDNLYYAHGGRSDSVGRGWSDWWGSPSCGTGSARVFCFARPPTP